MTEKKTEYSPVCPQPARVLPFLLLCTLLYVCPLPFCAAGDSGISGTSAYTVLPNGFEIYVHEDDRAPLVSVEIAVRAGTDIQTPQTAGFASLFADMIFAGNSVYPSRTDMENALRDMGASGTGHTVTTDGARYFATVPAASAADILRFYNTAFRTPLFSEGMLTSAVAQTEQDLAEEAASPGGFVNAALDARLFPAAPWKQTSGRNPELFRNMSAAHVASVLKDIQKRYYTPNNSALFISGNVRAADIFALAREIFGGWEQGIPVRPDNVREPQPQSTQFYVLADAAFPSGIIQTLIYFRGPDSSADMACVYPAAVWSKLAGNPQGKFAQSLAAAGIPGFAGSEYASAYYYPGRRDARFIFQAVLFPSTGTTPAEQAKKLYSHIRTEQIPAMTGGSYFSEEEITAAAGQLRNAHYASVDAAQQYVSALASAWLFHSPEYFFSYPEQIASVGQEDIRSCLERFLHDGGRADAVVFVLVSPDVLKKNRKDFENERFSVITQKTAPWYTRDIYGHIAEEPEGPAQTGEAEQTGRIFYESAAAEFTQFTLSNGIPVIIKHAPASYTLTVQIAAEGGELTCPAEKRGLETLLFSALAAGAGSTADAVITAETAAGFSVLSLECPSDSFTEAFSVFADSFLSAHLTPIGLDDIIWTMREKHRTKNGDPAFQLYSAGMQKLTAGTPLETYFVPQEELLTDITFEDVLAHYDSLLNASRLTVIVSGNTAGIDLKKTLDEAFGSLPAYPFPEKELPLLPVPDGQISVAVQRIFTSEIPAAGAGPQPETLTPTTVFSDPACGFFASPAYGSETYSQLACVLSFFEDTLSSILKEKYGAAQNVSVTLGTDGVPFGYIAVEGLSARRTLETAVRDAFILTVQPKTDSETRSIKNRYLARFYDRCTDNTGTADMIRDGFLLSKNPQYYIEEYSKIENTDWQTLSDIFTQWILEAPILWVFAE